MKYVMIDDKTFKKSWGNGPFFISSSTLLYHPRSQSKIKTTGNAKKGGTLIIPCVFNISHPLTYPKKLGGKDIKDKNHLELTILLSFSTLQCRLRSQKKTKSIRHKKNKTYYLHSYQIQYDLRLDLPKILGNRITTTKNT